MSRRLDRSWVVLDSLENAEGNRCVDIFVRPDHSYGFEEFRKDPEDNMMWSPAQHYSGHAFASKDQALEAARRVVGWLDSE